MVLLVGAVQRFAIVLALFLLGMGWLKLQPVPLLITFAVAQAAFALGGWAGTARSTRHVENI